MQVINSSLKNLVNQIASQLLIDFADKQLIAEELAVSLLDLTEQQGKQKTALKPADFAHFRGDEPIYPASIVKLFYLAAVHQWLADKKLTLTDELQRALKDMIIESSNDATHYVVDLLTDTTSGPELPAAEMKVWQEKRNSVNKYFHQLGYKNINVCQKTWSDGPFGREREFLGKDYENRNKLTTNATARLLGEIVTGQRISIERSKKMLALLARDFNRKSEDPDDQATGFIGKWLPKEAKLWSKAGWTSTVRHDAAYVELKNGIRFVLVVFISNHAKEYDLLPTITEKIIAGLKDLHG